MTVGPGRFRIRRAGSPGAGSASEGLVVQAVLLMAMVTTIGILVVASRVAGSRQSATAATLSNTARQAAEYGFTEIVAEMNRDSKSYLWVTRWIPNPASSVGGNWVSVTRPLLEACGVALPSGASIAENPMADFGTGNLPGSTGGVSSSYRLTKFEGPDPAGGLPNSPPAPGCINSFGNLIGGSAELSIEGTVQRGETIISTYTLKRTVSVKRAAPIFANPPSTRSFDPTDTRFASFYPETPPPPYFNITCESDGTSTTVIKCYSGALTQYFKSAIAPTNTLRLGVPIDDFPYLSGGNPWTPICNQVAGTIRCLADIMTVKTNANMLIKGTPDMPAAIFLKGNMIIEPGAKLSGSNWSGFRIFGVAPGGCPSQVIKINPDTTIPASGETNLQKAFLWLKAGELRLEGAPSALTSTPSLVGSVCQSNLSDVAISTKLSNRKLFEGLGGAYEFNGVFGRESPIGFFYRGFGSAEQSISP